MREQRFARPDYLFGPDPARYLTRHRQHFSPGQTALCIADGEGRNSVWLAGLELVVTALENAPSAIAKAQALAARQGVAVDIRPCNVLTEEWGPQTP